MREKGLILLLLPATAFLLGLPALRWPFSQDEVLTLILGRAPIGTALRCDVHPPLFYLWAKPILWLGGSIAWLRTTSLLLSALGATLIFLLAQTLWGLRGSILPVSLFLLSPLRLSLAPCARPFSLALSLDLLALLMAILYIKRGKAEYLALHALFSMTAVLTYALFTLSLLGRLAGGLLAHRRRGLKLVILSLPALSSVAAFHLLSPASGSAYLQPNLSFLTGLFIGLSEPGLGVSWFGWPREEVLVPLSILSAVAIWGAILCYREGGGARLIALSLALSVLGLGTVCGLGLVQPLGRYGMVALGPFVLCAGRASWGLRHRLMRAFCRVCLGGLIATGVGAVALLPRAQLTLDWPSLAEVVRRNVNPGEILICDPPSAGVILRRYLRKPVNLIPKGEVWFTRLGHFEGLNGRPFKAEKARMEMRKASKDAGRIWVLRWSNAPPVWPTFPKELGFKPVILWEFRGKVESAMLVLYRKEGLRVNRGVAPPTWRSWKWLRRP